MNAYINAWKSFLVDKWGLAEEFADRAAALVVWCSYYGLQPQITSGYRSKEYQAYLVDQWKKGNPNVHTPLPPGKSLHNNTTWTGKPAALAIDMVTNNSTSAGYLAKQLGLVWGGKSDHVHFGLRGGHL
jgi:hypothetical protein